MGSVTLVPVAEYLNTCYRPDVDYVDGELLERNMGEGQHSALQMYFGSVFMLHEQEWKLTPFPEHRVQVRPDRFRIPDVCAVPCGPVQRIITVPPVVCIEVLSSKDSLPSLKPRIEDYLAMGVRKIWVIDPWQREAYYASAAGYDPVIDGVLRIDGTPVEVSLAEAFARLDT